MPLEIIEQYHVSIANVIPKEKVNELAKRRRCYTGISISNPHFHGEYLYSLMNWIANNFSECAVLVDDYFHRFNAMLFEGLTEKEGLVLAVRQGIATEQEVKSILMELPIPIDFKVIRSSDLVQNVSFHKFYKIYKSLFDQDELFNRSLKKSAVDYIERQLNRGTTLPVTKEKAVDFSIGYLLEEITAFTVLCENGYDVEVYPGRELPVLIDIAKRKFDNIPQVVLNRINVELKIIKE